MSLARGRATGSWEGLPDDGRHLGSSPTAPFHEGTVKASSAPLTSQTGASRANTSASRPTGEGPGAIGEGGWSDRGVRGTVAWSASGRTGPWSRRSGGSPSPDGATERVPARPAEARRGVVKRSLPWSCRVGPRPHAASTRRKPRSLPGTHEVRFLAVRTGGRRRSDASRVFLAEGSQGLAAREGASRKEARKPRLTGGTCREKAKRCAGTRGDRTGLRIVLGSRASARGISTRQKASSGSPLRI